MSPRLKASVYLLLFGILTFIALVFRTPSKKDYSSEEVLGQKTNLVMFVEPEDGNRPIIEAIRAAKEEILVEVYLLSEPEIITALKEARARGVNVKTMLEQHPFGGGNLNDSSKKNLEDAGISVQWSSPKFTLTHEKMLAVDRKMVCILNMNLTKSAMSKNREYNICDENPEEVAEVTAIFSADWERKDFSPTSVNLVVSPDNSRGKIEALIRSAQKSLDLEMEVLEDREMMEIILEKTKTLPVRIIIPPLAKISSNAKAGNSLGRNMHILSSPYVHAKLIIADGSRAYLGSVNLSSQSLDKNRELGILVSQTDIIEKLSQIFEADFKMGFPLATP